MELCQAGPGAGREGDVREAGFDPLFQPFGGGFHPLPCTHVILAASCGISEKFPPAVNRIFVIVFVFWVAALAR